MYTSNLSNLILNSDSYKTSHWLQYPPGSEYMSSYVEARKGDYDVVFFAYKPILKNILVPPLLPLISMRLNWLLKRMAYPLTAQDGSVW